MVLDAPAKQNEARAERLPGEAGEKPLANRRLPEPGQHRVDAGAQIRQAHLISGCWVLDESAAPHLL